MPAHASAKQLRFFLRSIQMELITPYNVLIWATISTKGRIIATHDENRETILIVDDSAMNRMLLSDILADTYNIIEAEDGEQAIAILQQHASEISIVVLDMVMPKVDGFGVLEAMNENRWIQFLPVVSISTESSPEFVERAYSLGVTDFINRPFDELIVIRRVSNTIKLYAKQRKLTNMVANEIFEKERNGSLMITILSHIVEFRNGESGMHVMNIGTLTEILLNQISKKDDKYYLPYAERDLIDNMAAENWDEAFRAAHTLKGTARDMGFIDLSDRASEVTEALRASDAAQAKELLPAVEDAYKQVADAIAMFR